LSTEPYDEKEVEFICAILWAVRNKYSHEILDIYMSIRELRQIFMERLEELIAKGYKK
jgi:hypothetical protein